MFSRLVSFVFVLVLSVPVSIWAHYSPAERMAIEFKAIADFCKGDRKNRHTIWEIKSSCTEDWMYQVEVIPVDEGV